MLGHARFRVQWALWFSGHKGSCMWLFVRTALRVKVEATLQVRMSLKGRTDEKEEYVSNNR